MQLGMVGLGKMGGNMTQRLSRAGHEVQVHDLDADAVRRVEEIGGVRGHPGLAELVASLQAPRVVWVMVPAGEPTEVTLGGLAKHMQPGDVLIDGGNSLYRDTVRRAEELRQQGIALLDAGTSGGVWGLEEGYCLMVGGDEEAVRLCDPIFRALAQEGGFEHVGPAGSGHFVKMIHNGIEYGLLQAYAEGFELLRAAPFELELERIAALWNHGSVVRSWLLELLEHAFAQEGPELERVRGWVADSGEGRWTVETAIELSVPAPVITHSLLARFRSRQEESYSAQVIAALRNQFGGHAMLEAKPEDPVPG
jgi:6-phosphogluconate dehydrogenase